MPKLNDLVKSPLVRLLLPPFVGFFVYGVWAFSVNMSFGEMSALKAALTQGSYSFTITLVLAIVIEWLYNLLQAVPKSHWLVGAIACLLLYSTSWGVNALSGTPNIFWTVLPGAAVSTIYTVVYIVTLMKIKPTL